VFEGKGAAEMLAAIIDEAKEKAARIKYRKTAWFRVRQDFSPSGLARLTFPRACE